MWESGRTHIDADCETKCKHEMGDSVLQEWINGQSSKSAIVHTTFSSRLWV